ncbi:MAG TPA: response regulator [Stellaceae bacterium]
MTPLARPPPSGNSGSMRIVGDQSKRRQVEAPMRNILVVEDNSLVYETISTAFSLMPGFAVGHAANGYLALVALEAARPDLALIDIGLPKISGIEIAKRAVELEVPTVLMTGYADAVEQFDEHRFPVLSKPFRVTELVSRFDEIVTEAARLNRISLEQRKAGRTLIAEARALHRSISDANRSMSEGWARICANLEIGQTDRQRRVDRTVSAVVPGTDENKAARSLIAIHGADALCVAERGAANVRRLGMEEQAQWWDRVAQAVKSIAAARPHA